MSREGNFSIYYHWLTNTYTVVEHYNGRSYFKLSVDGDGAYVATKIDKPEWYALGDYTFSDFTINELGEVTVSTIPSAGMSDEAVMAFARHYELPMYTAYPLDIED